MKKIFVVSLIGAVFVGFGYYTIFATPANEASEKANKDKAEFAEEKIVPESKPAEPKKGAGTLEALRSFNEDLECSIVYKSDEQGVDIEGTYFVNDGDMRGDFLTQSPDLSGQTLSSVIINDSYVYVWSEIEGESYGVKSEWSSFENDESKIKMPVSLNANVFYDCKPWLNIDRTIFVPPGNVLFRDVNELIKAGMEYGTSY